MSTGTIPPSSVTPPPPPPPGGSARRNAKFIEYERFIDEQVQKTRSHVKSVDIISSLLTLLTGGLLAVLLISLFDHWIIPGGLGLWGRAVCFVLLSAGTIWYGVRRVVPLLWRRINPLYAAHTIEQTKPTFKNSLVSFLQFRQDRTVVSDAVYESIEQHAATSLTGAPVDAAVDRSALIRIGYILLAVLIACALYKVFSPKDPLTTLGRVLLPWADITPSTRVAIEDVKPGDAVFPRGKQVAVSAQVTGIGEDEPVTLFYRTADGQRVDAAVPMTVPADGYRYECLLPPGKERLRQDVTYRIEAGDFVTDDFHVTVESAPTIVVEAIEYDYPSYTDGDLSDRRDGRGGDIKALEGTRVTIHAVANAPITRAQVDFDCNGKLGPKMIVDGNRARYTFTLRFAKNTTSGDTSADRPGSRSSRPQHSSYQLKFWNQEGHDNDQQVRHVIEVTADLPPEVELLAPQEPELRVAADGSVEMEIYAIDPDFQLSDVRLTGRTDDGRTLKEIPLLSSGEVPYRGKFQRRFLFVPRKFDLKAGDVLTYQPLAIDNKRPSPNRSLGQSRRLVIIPARPGKGEQSASDDPADKKSSDHSNQEQQPDDQRRADDENSGDENSQDPAAKPDDSPMNDSAEQPGEAREESKGDQPNGADDKPDARQQGDEPGQPAQASPQDGDQGDKPGEENSGSGDSPDSGQGEQDAGAQDSGSRRGSSDEAADKSEAISELLDDLEKQQRENGGGNDGKTPENGTETSPDSAGDQGNTDKGDTDSANTDQGNTDSESRGEKNTDSGTKPDQGSGERKPKDGDATASDTESKSQGSPADKGEGTADDAQDKTGGDRGADAEPDPTEGNRPADDSAKPDEKSNAGQSTPGEGDPGKADTGKPSDDPQGSPASQGDNQTRKADGPKPDDSGDSSGDDAKTTSKSKRQSKGSSGETSGSESGGGEKGGGQNANQAGKDTPGSNEAADEGAGAAKERGKGEVGERAGQDAEADGPTGEGGETQGNGSKSREKLSGENSSDQPSGDRSSDPPKSKPDDGKTPGGQSRQGDPADASDSKIPDADPASSEPGAARGKPGDRTDPELHRTPEETAGDDPNLEYTKKATDLALEHLRDMMENDPERLKTILKKLNRDEDWIKKVLEQTERDRRNAAGTGASAEAARQNLRNLGLRPRSQGARTTDAAADNVSGLTERSVTQAPPQYQRRLRAYRKRAAQRGARWPQTAGADHQKNP